MCLVFEPPQCWRPTVLQTLLWFCTSTSTYLGPRNEIVDSTFINKFDESLVLLARPTGRGQLLFVALSVSEKRDFNESICSSLNLPLLDICDLKKRDFNFVNRGVG